MADLALASVNFAVSTCVEHLLANIDNALFADGTLARAALDPGPERVLLVATGPEGQAVAWEHLHLGLSRRRLIGLK